MPSSRIVTGEWARGREMELIEAVPSAMLNTIKIPEWDRDVVVDLYDGNRPIIPTGRSERFTRIEIELFSGRSMEAKRALYREQKQAAWRAFEPPSSRQEGQQARHCLDPWCAHAQ